MRRPICVNGFTDRYLGDRSIFAACVRSNHPRVSSLVSSCLPYVVGRFITHDTRFPELYLGDMCRSVVDAGASYFWGKSQMRICTITVCCLSVDQVCRDVSVTRLFRAVTFLTTSVSEQRRRLTEASVREEALDRASRAYRETSDYSSLCGVW